MALRLSQLEKTYRRNPKSILFAHLADLYLHKDQVSRALSLCKAGCELLPDYPTGFTILGKCYQARGDLEEARAAQQRALDLDPENPGGLVRLAEIFHDLGRPAQALENLHKAASLDDLSDETKELMDRLTYALRVESTGAGADDLLDSETRLDALALEMDREEEEGEAPRNSAGEADPASGDGQIADTAETAATESRRAEDEELHLLFQEIESREEGELPAPQPILAAAEPAAGGDHPFATATLAQIYSDQGLVQRAADTYRQVLARDPGNKEIKRRLAELE